MTSPGEGDSGNKQRSLMWMGVFIPIVLGVLCSRHIFPLVYPWGLPLPMPQSTRPQVPKIDTSNESLRFKSKRLKKIVERLEHPNQEPLLKGPETVVIGNDGKSIYALTEDGNFVSIHDLQPHEKEEHVLTANVTLVKDLGMGRPLGGAFDAHGNLYVADTLLGLLRVKRPLDKSPVEMLASRVQVQNPSSSIPVWSRIVYADDVVVGPKTGKVYFTDACEIAPDRVKDNKWDTLYASKVDLLRQKRTGRVLEYDPRSGKVQVLADELFFANGIAVDKDEAFLFVSETFAARSVKINLQSSKVETMKETYVGYNDGCDCDHATGLCYVAIPTTVPKLMKLLYHLPHPLDWLFRTLILALPRSLSPAPECYGGFVQVHPGNDKEGPSIRKIVQDPFGTDIDFVAGVTVAGTNLYLGFLKNDYIGVYDLS